MTKREWDVQRALYEKGGGLDLFSYLKDEAEAIRRNVDWLLERLYEAHPTVGARCSDWASQTMGVEPINWCDLSCTEVRQFADGCWHVVLEEATPGRCPALCRYVYDWMRRWGWDVVVETDW